MLGLGGGAGGGAERDSSGCGVSCCGDSNVWGYGRWLHSVTNELTATELFTLQ